MPEQRLQRQQTGLQAQQPYPQSEQPRLLSLQECLQSHATAIGRLAVASAPAAIGIEVRASVTAVPGNGIARVARVFYIACDRDGSPCNGDGSRDQRDGSRDNLDGSPDTRDRSADTRDRSADTRDRSADTRDRSADTRDRSPHRRYCTPWNRDCTFGDPGCWPKSHLERPCHHDRYPKHLACWPSGRDRWPGQNGDTLCDPSRSAKHLPYTAYPLDHCLKHPHRTRIGRPRYRDRPESCLTQAIHSPLTSAGIVPTAARKAFSPDLSSVYPSRQPQ
jgi:hypothetical protein